MTKSRSFLALAIAAAFAINHTVSAADNLAPIKSESTEQAVHVGTVKWFNESKGFGWISWEGGPDAYVDYRNIEGAGFKSLVEGQKVQFEIDPVKRGPRGGPLAIHVRAI
jgi:cold shock protein